MNVKQLKQKKLLLFVGIPFFLIGMFSVVFWGMGGFQDHSQNNASAQGLNTKLPAPVIEDKNPLDKLSIYLQAEKDSTAKAQQIVRDPFFKRFSDSTLFSESSPSGMQRVKHDAPFAPWQERQTHNDRLLQDKLKQLQDQLDNHAALAPPDRDPDKIEVNTLLNKRAPSFPDIRQPTGSDPELMQIDSMLNKILEIQHPERVTQQLGGSVIMDEIKPFQVSNRSPADTLLWSTHLQDEPRFSTVISRNRFYELDEFVEQDSANVIPATIYGTQQVTSGMSVTIRLDQDIYINNHTIPAGTLLYGEGKLTQDRYMVSIGSISYERSLFPVTMEVYSLDGMIGIPINGAMSQQVAKQGMDRSVQSLQITSLNPSLAAQAASAGIESAKTFLSKKARLIKVTLKDGHPVLLRNIARGR